MNKLYKHFDQNIPLSIIKPLEELAGKTVLAPTGQEFDFGKDTEDIINSFNWFGYSEHDYLNGKSAKEHYPLDQMLYDKTLLVMSTGNATSTGFILTEPNPENVYSWSDDDFEYQTRVKVAENLYDLVKYGSYRIPFFYYEINDELSVPCDIEKWLDNVYSTESINSLELYSLFDKKIEKETVVGKYRNQPIILKFDTNRDELNGIYLNEIKPENLIAYTITEFFDRMVGAL